MKAFGTLSGLLVLGIGFYIYANHDQTRDVSDFCARYAEGASTEDFFEVADSYSGNLMGGKEFSDKVKPQLFIYCAPITMCDVSCRLEIEDGVVTKSEYSSL